MNRFCLLVTSLSMLTLAAEAQITKGTKLLGGSVGYSQSRNTSASRNPTSPITQPEYEQITRSFNVSPRVGVFIADNLAAGISVGYSSQKATAPYYDYYSSGNPVVYQQTGRSHTFNAAPFLRYYYLPTATFGVFGQLTASYGVGKSKTENTAPNQPSNEAKSYGFGIGISPALVFFPIDKLGLELAFGGIGYGRNTSKTDAVRNQPEAKSTSSSFGANFGLDQLSLGASYYFGR
jgi:Outer membrane protein beta-barrel domain